MIQGLLEVVVEYCGRCAQCAKIRQLVLMFRALGIVGEQLQRDLGCIRAAPAGSLLGCDVSLDLFLIACEFLVVLLDLADVSVAVVDLFLFQVIGFEISVSLHF